MANFMSFITLICVLSLRRRPIFAADTLDGSRLQTYIVHVDIPDGEERFAARLSPDEVKDMEKKEGFVYARPEEILPLHTTHSPKFLGLNQNTGFWNESNYGRGVIIGVLDGGIFPQHPSFSDQGMPSPPAKWKGKCEFKNTTCNNKIIGARYLLRFGYQSLLDNDGHGTHTAGTAAGNFVRGANIFGLANGTAAGIAPHAHLAIYKVCDVACPESSILAGIDAAVEDGVDVLSISIGSSGDNFARDFTAIGAFGAMEKGVFVSCSAGNRGPFSSTLSNEAPWILTVGASTTDRKTRATAVLGNNQQLHGTSAYQPNSFSSNNVASCLCRALNTSHPSARYCSRSSLDGTDIRGKIVVCDIGGGVSRTGKGEAIRSAGGAAMIMVNNEHIANTTIAEAHVVPATHVSYEDGLRIKAYINSMRAPVATIRFAGTVFGDNRAPVVAAFSSRGPNSKSPGILKPDILGPGVDILAAWHVPLPLENNTKTNFIFNMVSGTSMSSPHLSGVAALLKSAHPSWSPAAIKSAIMTTADVVNHAQNPLEDEMFLPARIFATGAGHVNPSKANDPGLIYDIQLQDYIPYLCGLNYTNREVGYILQRWVNCSEESHIPEAQLNYPSFALTFRPASTPQVYTRIVTNVGNPTSSYNVEIVPPPGVTVLVDPTTLNFTRVNQKIQYRVTFSRLTSAQNNAGVVQGFLRWTSSKHSVRSPIAVTLQ
ncbi:Subtilisin-like protease SBT1.2 [Sesamum alatum]|uniref:Subtilisin-like protease SBT1.2 n=1 Tax=Sesamum alatum TaxID=300844 RepID=A0AAE1YRR6_9LAMI|nr:Subtilisin-like protease SBT1.2 [Sesamum alatum]